MTHVCLLRQMQLTDLPVIKLVYCEVPCHTSLDLLRLVSLCPSAVRLVYGSLQSTKIAGIGNLAWASPSIQCRSSAVLAYAYCDLCFAGQGRYE